MLEMAWAQHVVEHSILEGVSTVKSQYVAKMGVPFRIAEDRAMQEEMSRQWQEFWPGVEPKVEVEDRGEQRGTFCFCGPRDDCQHPLEFRYVTHFRFRRV